MKTRRSYTLFIISILSIAFVGGQPLSIHNLNIESGMSNNYVRTFFKDSQGLMWFGTDTGLDSYDGLQITNYAKRFKTPLKGAVQSIIENDRGILLVGTSWGAFRYNIRKNEITPIDFGIPAIDVRTIFTSSKGITYVATDRGLFTLDRNNLKTKAFPLKRESAISLTDILEDQWGTIWVAGNEGLCEIKKSSPSASETNIYSFTQNIRVIKLVGNTIYMGTLRGLFAYDIIARSIHQIQGTAEISILSLAKSDEHHLFVGTDNYGILKISTQQGSASLIETKSSSIDHLSSKTVSALYFDVAKTLWIGTFDSGIDFRNLQNSKKFNTLNLNNIDNSNIRSLYFAPNGNKYLGTRNGKLLVLDANNQIKQVITSNNGKNFRSRILTTIAPYPGHPNLLLIGTFGGGISVFNTQTMTCSEFSHENIFLTGTTYKFCTDSQNRLWIATLDGLYCYYPVLQKIDRYDVAMATGSNEVFTLHFDGKDKIWIGTKTGICFYSVSKKKLVQPEAAKKYRFQCTSTFVDRKGNSWFCFNKGGVLELDARLHEKRWLTKEIGLPENAPSSLVEDREGNIWIGTSKGLYKVNPNHSVQAFGLEDGLTGVGFCPESALQDAKGNLWWSNEKGLVTFLNDKSAINPIVPNLKFTELFINGQKYDADTLTFAEQTGKLHYSIFIKGKSNNNLEFRVAALNYKNARRNQYSFLLQGIDKSWSKPSTNPTISYNELSPGTYSLKVKASNNDDIWTSEPTEIKVTISPWFYETTWFVVLIWSLIGGAIIYFTRSYIIHMKMRIFAQLEEIKKRQTNSTPSLKITEEKGNEILTNLQNYMQMEKPYLSPELRQADLANTIGCSIHELSQVINAQLNQNFSDFVNSHRVEEMKLRIKNGDTMKYTLTAIALQCGFSSKSSFLRAFKKATGLNPSDYLKENNHSDKL